MSSLPGHFVVVYSLFGREAEWFYYSLQLGHFF